jgi:hypothetical protein
MSNIVNLHSASHDPTDHPEDDLDLVADLVRFDEGLLSQQSIKTKYRGRFDDAAWTSFGENEALIRAIDLEKIRRVRDGSAKREKAQLLVVKAPQVLGDIMNDPGANPRHRIDSAKVLDDLAANGPQTATAEARFVIQINLGADTECYSKSIKIDPLDEDPFHPTPPEVIAAIAAKKNEGGGGEHL